jgi:hypothetical protein
MGSEDTDTDPLSEYKLLGWKVEYHYKKELNEKENIPLD